MEAGAARPKRSGASGEPRHWEGGDFEIKRQKLDSGLGRGDGDAVSAPIPVVAAAPPGDDDPEADLNAALLRAKMMMMPSPSRSKIAALSRDSLPALPYQADTSLYILEGGGGSGIPPPPPINALGQSGGGGGGGLQDGSQAADLDPTLFEPAPVSDATQTPERRHE